MHNGSKVKKPYQVGKNQGNTFTYLQVSVVQWLDVRLRQAGPMTDMGQTGKVPSITPYPTTSHCHVYSAKSCTGRLAVSSCRLRLTSQRFAHTDKLGLEERQTNKPIRVGTGEV